MKRNNLANLASALILGLMTITTYAAVPNTINYQGFLTDATTGQPQNATVSVTFKLYNVQIGSVVGTPLFEALAFDKPYWLEITVGAQVLTPRQPLASSATTLRAAVADSLPPVPGSGAGNVAVGYAALQANTAGSYNGAFGAEALRYNTAGYANTATGTFALNSNTIGFDNTASGFLALGNNTTASNNVAIGSFALEHQGYPFNNGGVAWDSFNTAVGSQALRSNGPTATTNGVLNTAVGGKALYANTTGTYNTANGASALQSNNIGNWNTAVGYSALLNNSNGSSNAAFGSNVLAGNSSGTGNVAVGDGSMYVNTTGNNNTAVGQFALKNNVSGSGNIAIGYSSGTGVSVGSNNIDIGNTGVPADTGIIRIGTAGTHSATYIAGSLYIPSDRNLKENFSQVNVQDVLTKVASLPLQVWNYKQDNPNTRHIGPMAQDFAAAFAVGSDDKHIATVDESGVALAAIKGLYEKLLAKDKEIAKMKKKSNSLERELAAIKSKLNIK
jgi:hypothetical protein